MRTGCAGLRAGDGEPASYEYIKIVTSKDSPTSGGAGGGGTGPSGGGIRGCGDKKAGRVVPLHYRHRIVRAIVYINGKRVKVYRGHSLKRVAIPEAGGGRQVVKIVLVSSTGRRYTSVRTYKGCKKTRPHRVER
jgi:hypothetical protein